MPGISRKESSVIPFSVGAVVTHLISNVFQQIPGLVTLKKFPCVSFAGVDSLNDVKNRTYHDLFVSGGFVVSDESVLNPESITTGRCGASGSFRTKILTFQYVRGPVLTTVKG